MKRYEGLFILDTAGRDEGLTETIDQIKAAIAEQGGAVETVQKMDRKPFARVAHKKHSAGFYTNIIFEAQPDAIRQLREKFRLRGDIFRVLFTSAPEPAAAA